MVAERGEEGVAKVRELTGGDGTHTVLECVGLRPAIETAYGVVRAGGTISRVGAPQYPDVPADFGTFLRNITLTGGVAPARAYIEELLPDVLDGTVEPGKVFDRTVGLDERSRRLPRHGRPRGAQGAGASMSAWSNDELTRIGEAGELDIATRRADGTLRKQRIIWVVRLGRDRRGIPGEVPLLPVGREPHQQCTGALDHHRARARFLGVQRCLPVPGSSPASAAASAAR